MMPKASLNCWMAEWEKESKMLAFLGMMELVVVPVGPERCSSWSKRSSWLAHICSTPMCVLALAYGYKGWQPYDGLFYHLMLVTVEW